MKKPIELLNYIKYTNKSYSQLISNVNRKFRIRVGKSLISYYKRRRPRVIPVNFNNVKKWELEWLKGLYFADGCKFREKNFHYTIKFALDSKRDEYIIRRVISILKRLQVNLLFSKQKNAIIIRVFSKILYAFLPDKNNMYFPKNLYAFISGLIDGDGNVHKNRVVICQNKHRKLMDYLVKKLELRYYRYKTKSKYIVNYYKNIYYVTVKLRQKLIKNKFCVKLNRNNMI